MEAALSGTWGIQVVKFFMHHPFNASITHYTSWYIAVAHSIRSQTNRRPRFWGFKIPRHSLSEIRLWRKGRNGNKLGVPNLCSTWDFICKVAAQEQNGTF
jgi:hypothetical protein